MEKQKITVRVAGKAYTLVSYDPPEHVRRVAELVDRRLREMEIATSLPSAQVLTLTCLNLEDQLVKAQDEIQELKRRLAKAEQEGCRAWQRGETGAAQEGTQEPQGGETEASPEGRQAPQGGETEAEREGRQEQKRRRFRAEQEG